MPLKILTDSNEDSVMTGRGGRGYYPRLDEMTKDPLPSGKVADVCGGCDVRGIGVL